MCRKKKGAPIGFDGLSASNHAVRQEAMAINSEAPPASMDLDGGSPKSSEEEEKEEEPTLRDLMREMRVGRKKLSKEIQSNMDKWTVFLMFCH